MNLVWAGLIVLAATVAAVGAMLWVRRSAPDGLYFHDGDRAAGVFGVLATGFSVLLGFLIFLTFDSYDASRSGAETEAQMVVQQVETAQFLPAEQRDVLAGQLVCYARWVVEDEWGRMEDATLGDDINPWGAALFVTFEQIEPGTASEEAAYAQWLDQRADREDARQDRIHGAEGVMPLPLWIALTVIATIIFVFMLFFADRGEPAVVQGMLMGSVVAVITTMLLLLAFLDRPYHDGVGGLQPVAMERSLVLVDEGLSAIGKELTAPCDASGAPI